MTRLLYLVPALLLLGTPARADERFDWLARRLLHDSSYKVRLQAAIALGKRTTPEAREVLARALDDPKAAVRAVAAISLGKVGGPAQRRALEDAARDPEPLVAAAARRALAQLGERLSSRPEPSAGGGFEASGPGLASTRHPSALDRLQDRLNPEFTTCLLRQLRRDPRFPGVTVRLTVAPAGTLEGFRLLGLSAPAPRLDRCMRAAVDEVALPAAGGGSVTLTWPLKVSP